MYGPGTVWFDDLEVAYLKETDKAKSKPDKSSEAKERGRGRSQNNKPRVVSTNPAALANDVSADLTKITVTFDTCIFNPVKL